MRRMGKPSIDFTPGLKCRVYLILRLKAQRIYGYRGRMAPVNPPPGLSCCSGMWCWSRARRVMAYVSCEGQLLGPRPTLDLKFTADGFG